MARTQVHGWLSHAAGLAAVATLAMAPSVAADQPARQSSGDSTQRVGSYVTTGGTLNFGDKSKQPPRRAASAQPADQHWLPDLIERLLAGTPEQQQQPQQPLRRAAVKRPAVAKAAPPATQPTNVTALPITPTQPVVPAAAAPNVITGAINTGAPSPSTLPDLNRNDLDAGLIGDAEISQAREDLIKLELARRTYDETRLSGATAFDTRLDWRILERGRDAWHATELSAALAAGFEANTYINDTTKTIVVAVAGTQDLRRDFIEADIWRALIQAEAPQHFYLAKSYVRSVQSRYQAAGYHTECVGHSLGGGACAYAAAELGIRAIVLNPISAGRLNDIARNFVTNYVVDGDIAAAIYQLRGNDLTGDIQKIRHNRDAVRDELRRRYGFLSGPIRVVRDLQNSVKVHQIERALDIIAAYAGTPRVK
jgi:hypothetical protein